MQKHEMSYPDKDSLEAGGEFNEFDLTKLTPIKQLEALSEAAEKAYDDVGWSMFSSKRLVEDAIHNKNLPPITRIAAKSFEPIVKDFGMYGEDYHMMPSTQKEDIGYYTIATPEMLASSTGITEAEGKGEEAILTELNGLTQTDESSQDEELWRKNYNRQLILEQALRNIWYSNNQAKLHREFPEAPNTNQIIKVAPDAVAVLTWTQEFDHDGLFSLAADSIMDDNGNIISEDDDSAKCLKMIHGNRFLRSYLDSILNVNLANIPFESQKYLLSFMMEAGNERFDNLCETLQKMEDENLREKTLGAFLATDFGEDFGDGLLDIANSERISSEQLGEILDGMESCRESIHGITSLYEEFDGGKFANEYARASNERLTDALMVFQQIAKTGKAEADLGWAGKTEFDYNDAIEALKYEMNSLKIINGTLEDVSSGKKGAFVETVLPSDYYSQFTLYNLYSPGFGYVLLYTRPEGSGTFDETIEYGKHRSKYDTTNNNAGVEASISLITNPVNPFVLPKPYKPDFRAVKNPHFYDESIMDKVSAIRLDREGRAPGAPADDPERNPMNAVGTVSVDLAAINDRADTPSGKIARLFSVGNKLREEQSGTSFNLNHNTHWFDQDSYGKADGFKGLVGYIDSLMHGWCNEHKPGKDDESFRKLMRAFGKAGRAAA